MTKARVVDGIRSSYYLSCMADCRSPLMSVDAGAGSGPLSAVNGRRPRAGNRPIVGARADHQCALIYCGYADSLMAAEVYETCMSSPNAASPA